MDFSPEALSARTGLVVTFTEAIYVLNVVMGHEDLAERRQSYDDTDYLVELIEEWRELMGGGR